MALKKCWKDKLLALVKIEWVAPIHSSQIKGKSQAIFSYGDCSKWTCENFLVGH